MHGSITSFIVITYEYISIMVNVDTLVKNMQSRPRRSEPCLKKSTSLSGSQHSSEPGIGGDTMTSNNTTSVIVEDGPVEALTVDDVRRQVERLRLEVEMVTAGRARGEASVELSAEAIAQGFTSPEDFKVREDAIEYEDGSSYRGEMLGMMRHGKGVYKDASGAEYSGEFKYNTLEGNARAKMPDGSSYDGEWVGGNPHGAGRSVYPGGGVYTGDFEHGGRNGWGTMVFSNGDEYEGEWKNDQIHGQGRWLYGSDGSHFQGTFEKGERVHGTFLSHDGSEEYRGDWLGGSMHGKGFWYMKSLGKYEGYFKDNVPDGEGTFVYLDGSVYEGHFCGGVKSGAGILKSKDFLYQGDWSDDTMHGKGFLRDSGDTYVGEFQRGKKHGKGRMQYHNGTVYEGEWEDGYRHGQGTCKFEGGDVYVGQWANDNRHGQGICKFADGTKFRGTWEEDAWVQTGADPNRTRIAGAGTVRAEVGKLSKFVIQARDELGNKRLSGGDEFKVQLVLHGQCGNPEIDGDSMITITGNVKDNEDGTYEVTYQPRVSGVYELSVLTETTHEHVADSPYPVRVLPGSPSFRKTMVRNLPHKCICDSDYEFEIHVRDQYGNTCSGMLSNVAEFLNTTSIRLEGATASTAANVEVYPTVDGRILCSYTSPSQVGYYRLHVEDEKGVAVPGTPLSIHCVSSLDEETDTHATDVVPKKNTDPQVNSEISKKKKKVEINVDLWEKIAKDSYFAVDGSKEGWDSDEEASKVDREKEHARAHPDVPIVENLEDLWLVSKLQQERKMKEEKMKQSKLQAMHSTLEDLYGPGSEPSVQEAQHAIKEIVEQDFATIFSESDIKGSQSRGEKLSVTSMVESLDALL